MIDVDSIKELKYKNEDAVLKAFLVGASVRDAATLCGVSPKTAHKIRLKHADKLPEREIPPKLGVIKKVAGIKRWVTVPADVDAKICKVARAELRKWGEQANLIFKEWGDPKEKLLHISIGSEKFDIPLVLGETSIQTMERVVDYLNKHGNGGASIKDGAFSYYGQNVFTINEGKL